MRLTYSIEQSDLSAVEQLLQRAIEHPFVIRRIQDNVSGPAPQFSREEFWRVMLGCLLTTQQRSGPEGRVARLLREKPFQLPPSGSSPDIVQAATLRSVAEFGGIRRGPTIAKQAAANFRRLGAGDWARVQEQFETLLMQRNREPREGDAAAEREAAVAIDEFEGFGPKQSRNLWQWLGLTRYEIPLDSRVTAWLNRNRVFPFALCAQALADGNYYGFLMNGIQQLCAAANVLPCVLMRRYSQMERLGRLTNSCTEQGGS